MVAHGLAIALWLGSVALYGAAFFFPEVHRRHDFFWSGVAAFYGLVLWFDAAQISSTELLGHGASLALLGWLGWQTLTLRRKRTPLDLQTPLTDESWPTFWASLQRSGLGWAKATPLGRWLPEAWESPPAVDLAIAVAEIRASSLKDVDYEFVDELAGDPELESGARAIAPAEPTPAPMPSKPRSPKNKSKQPVGRSQPAPAAPKPAAPNSQPIPQPGRIAGLRNWLGNLVKARPSAKPSREVIEIPPRPSPLDRKRSKQEGSKQEGPKRKTSKRAVIDIPPRPSPLDRKRPSASAQPPQGADSSPDLGPAVTIVDATVVDAAPGESINREKADLETDGLEAIAPPSPAESAEPTTPIPAPEPRPAPPEASSENAWDNDDSNWIED